MTPYLLGLTGSIGMGKSTTASMFADEGIPVWSADACVHRLYAPGGEATRIVENLYPAAIKDGAVSRAILREMIAKEPAVLDHLQSAVHPLVAADRAAFISEKSDEPIILLDVPLLFESGADAQCDGIIVVTAPAAVQRARVLARGEMTEADLRLILSRQMPDAEKRRRATWVIDTTDMDRARAAVNDILKDIRKGLRHA
jgi:dephospho-CoA kinase